ncbi:MAG: hypothetical protein QM753_08800 [Thermomicrobiales bacterium]
MSHSTLLPTESAELRAHADRAAKARAEGMQLLRAQTGEYYATSKSKPGTLHRVTLASCGCLGFVRHQHCRHHSALVMAHLHQELSEAPALAPACACERCQDVGTVEVHHSRWIGGATLGYRDQWTMQEPCPVCRADEYAYIA